MATLITAPSATQLAELGTLKLELGIVDTTQDDQLGRYLDQASALIASYTGRSFPRAQWQDVFRLRGERRRTLILSERPVTSIEALNIDGDATDATALDLDENAGLLLRPHNCALGAWWAHKIVVIYTAGYLVPGQPGRDLPANLERACLDTAKGLFHAADRDPQLRSEAAQGVGSTSWLDPDVAGGGLPQGVAAMLSAAYPRTGFC